MTSRRLLFQSSADHLPPPDATERQIASKTVFSSPDLKVVNLAFVEGALLADVGARRRRSRRSRNRPDISVGHVPALSAATRMRPQPAWDDGVSVRA